ncbi:hypothetical protein [Pasteurella multocida]|nr:hypothetical protein [Pasteurella multocida]
MLDTHIAFTTVMVTELDMVLFTFQFMQQRSALIHIPSIDM